MKRGILLIGLLLGGALWLTAQTKIELPFHQTKYVEIRLSDNSKTTNDFLLNLPLAFKLTEKNLLLVMVGNDTLLNYGHSVWFFSEEMNFAQLMKKNHNVGAVKPFKKQNTVLKTICSSVEKMTLFRSFDDGYEIVKKNMKPVLFEILNPSSKEPIRFSLQFYVAKPDAAFPYFFIAKCKPVEFELIIK